MTERGVRAETAAGYAARVGAFLAGRQKEGVIDLAGLTARPCGRRGASGAPGVGLLPGAYQAKKGIREKDAWARVCGYAVDRRQRRGV